MWFEELRVCPPPTGMFLTLKQELLSSHVRLASKNAFGIMLEDGELMESRKNDTGAYPRVYFKTDEMLHLMELAEKSGVNIENIIQLSENGLKEFNIELRTSNGEKVSAFFCRPDLREPVKSTKFDGSTVEFELITDAYVKYEDKHKKAYHIRISRISSKKNKRQLAAIHVDLVKSQGADESYLYYQNSVGAFIRGYAAIQFAAKNGMLLEHSPHLYVGHKQQGMVSDYSVDLTERPVEIEFSEYSGIPLRSRGYQVVN